MNPLDRLRNVKQQAESADEARAMFRRYIQHARRNLGWNDDDVREYTDVVKVLMGKHDAAVLALYQDGFFKTADEAREAALEHWRCYA